MKTKLLAIALLLLCLVQPAAAVGMVGVESAEEMAIDVSGLEEATLAATDYSSDETILLKEDFEGYETDGASIVGQSFSYAKSGVTNINIGIAANTYTAVSASFDNKKVAKVSGITDSFNMSELSFKGLPIVGAGTYEFSIDYYLESGTYANFGTWHSSIISQTSKLNDKGVWKTNTIKFVVTSNSAGTYDVVCYNPLGTQGSTYTGRTTLPDFTPGYTTDKAGASFVYYVDNLTLKYSTPATVTYVDGDGNTLKTVDVKVGEIITLANSEQLGIDYNPSYKINGQPYFSSSYTVTENVTIVVSESSVVLMENFENVDDGWVYENNGFTFDVSTAATKATFINTDRAGVSQNFASVVDTAESETATLAANGTKAFKFGNKVNNYALTGFAINNLPVSEVGDYELTFKTYTVGANGWNSISTYVDAEGTYLAIVPDKWINWSIPMTVTEEGGVKTVTITSMGDGKTLSHQITGDTLGKRLQVLWIGGADAMKVEGNYTMYVDDICLTYEKPSEPASISFVDIQGNELSYKTEAISKYTLPTAAQLGLAYEPEFTLDEVTYVPGDIASVSAGADVVFSVSETDVIFKETFDTTTFKVGQAANAANTARVTKYDGDNAAYYGAGSWMAYTISGFEITKPGVYDISIDLKLDPGSTGATNFATYFYMYGATENDGTSSVENLHHKAGEWTTAKATLVVYEKDGKLYYNNADGTPIELINGKITNLGFGGDVRGIASGTPTMYVDNFMVTFKPNAPKTLKLVSYRVEDENGKGGLAGIRFGAYVTAEQKQASTEYGFIVTLKSSITTNGTADYSKVNLDGMTGNRTYAVSGYNNDNVRVIAGAAYNDSVNRVYTEDGSIFNNGTLSYTGIYDTFFTGVLYGIPEGQEDTVFVARPYIVVDGTFYYGDCIERTYNEVLNAAGIG